MSGWPEIAEAGLPLKPPDAVLRRPHIANLRQAPRGSDRFEAIVHFILLRWANFGKIDYSTLSG